MTNLDIVSNKKSTVVFKQGSGIFHFMYKDWNPWNTMKMRLAAKGPVKRSM